MASDGDFLGGIYGFIGLFGFPWLAYFLIIEATQIGKFGSANLLVKTVDNYEKSY